MTSIVRRTSSLKLYASAHESIGQTGMVMEGIMIVVRDVGILSRSSEQVLGPAYSRKKANIFCTENQRVYALDATKTTSLLFPPLLSGRASHKAKP